MLPPNRTDLLGFLPGERNRVKSLWQYGSPSTKVRWLVNPLDEGPMKRVNNFPFYELGKALRILQELDKDEKFSGVSYKIREAQRTLQPFLDDKILPLPLSKPSGTEVLNALRGVTEKGGSGSPDADKELGNTIYTIWNRINIFENVLAAELQQLDTYFVPKTGIYSTTDLIERADDLFLDKANLTDELKHEFREAGKCIAFGLATAAGFHIWRATETVIIAYIKVVTGSPPKTSDRNWGAYVKILKDGGADDKVCGALDQLRTLHRNPTMHPEVVLTVTEADSLLGMAKSAIIAMTVDIAKRKGSSTPAAPATGASVLGFGAKLGE